MSVSEKRTELLVGLFVFFGLAIMAVLILQFGRFGDRLRDSYALHVKFKDASGILSGVDVRVGGVKVGTVEGRPRADKTLDRVIVDLRIYSDYQIPDNSEVRIRASGLMGDNYISVKMDDTPSETYFKDQQTIEGKTPGDLAELTDTAEELSEQARQLIAELTKTVSSARLGLNDLNSALSKFDTDVLGAENLGNIKEAISNYKTLSENLSEASANLSPAIDEVKGAVHNANGAFEGAQEIVLQMQPIIDDLETAANAVNHGDGILNALLNDPALRADFIALIANLKEHGVLRYKDSAPSNASALAPAQPTAPEAAPPEKKSWRPFNRKR